MTATLPPPLTAPCIDCTDLPGFLLNVERLMASELVAIASHEVIGAALLLWCRAWKQRPAASLPDDDAVLAAFARMPVARFRKLRAQVLHGFVKCSDGRLYHRVLADEATKAFKKKVAFRHRRETDADRLRKWRARGGETDGEPACETQDETRFETRSEREGQCKGQCKGQTSALRAGADAPPPVAEVEVTVEAEAEAPDAREALWRDGLAIVGRLTGKPPAGCRSLVGRWLRDLKDDCAALLLILREAEAARPVDPVPWIAAAIAARGAPPVDDPWGLRAWLARQPDVTLEPAEAGGEPVACLADGVVQQWAQHIAEAAGLLPSWRGSWDAMGAWMRDGVGLTPAVLEAVRAQADRAAARGEGVSSMRFFDATVRAAAGRRAA